MATLRANTLRSMLLPIFDQALAIAHLLFTLWHIVEEAIGVIYGVFNDTWEILLRRQICFLKELMGGFEIWKASAARDII